MNALETQSHIVSAAMPIPPEPVLIQSPKFDAFLNVCLCDVTAEDKRAFVADWAFCKQHDWAIKLASMKELNVLLHVRNAQGEIVPLRGEA